jgi:predicted hydrocarbon binding protein
VGEPDQRGGAIVKGIIFNLLESLIIEKFGDEIIEEIYDEAEFSADVPPFVGPETYPDEDLFAMVPLLAQKSGLTVDDLVYAFGKYMFPVLADTYPGFLKGIESPVEFLGTVNDVIHVEVKKLFEGATPPMVVIEEANGDRATLRYSSERQLCRLAEGLLDGVADHFGQRVAYSHRQCMQDGADACVLDIEFRAENA